MDDDRILQLKPEAIDGREFDGVIIDRVQNNKMYFDSSGLLGDDTDNDFTVSYVWKSNEGNWQAVKPSEFKRAFESCKNVIRVTDGRFGELHIEVDSEWSPLDLKLAERDYLTSMLRYYKWLNQHGLSYSAISGVRILPHGSRQNKNKYDVVDFRVKGKTEPVCFPRHLVPFTDNVVFNRGVK